MTTLQLTKHHGLGNDFLVVFHPGVTDLAALARRLCDRRRGVGADGLLVGESSTDAAASMVLYNADGSRAEMSGNGIRCFAQALATRRGDTLPVEMAIGTDAGCRHVTVVSGDGDGEVLVSVDMGPVTGLAEPDNWSALGCDPLRPVRHLSLGNPHSVVGVDDVRDVDLVALGQLVPQVNLEVVQPGGRPDELRMRVHERGAGITEACGTGACASAWAAVGWGLATPLDGKITVHMDGGSAKVLLHDPSEGRVTLVGPAQYVAGVTVEL